MRYAVEIDSGVTIHIPSFVKIGCPSYVDKVIHRHRQHGYLISLFLFFRNKKNKLKNEGKTGHVATVRRFDFFCMYFLIIKPNLGTHLATFMDLYKKQVRF
jgi:hypothetical protein